MGRGKVKDWGKQKTGGAYFTHSSLRGGLSSANLDTPWRGRESEMSSWHPKPQSAQFNTYKPRDTLTLSAKQPNAAMFLSVSDTSEKNRDTYCQLL